PRTRARRYTAAVARASRRRARLRDGPGAAAVEAPRAGGETAPRGAALSSERSRRQHATEHGHGTGAVLQAALRAARGPACARRRAGPRQGTAGAGGHRRAGERAAAPARDLCAPAERDAAGAAVAPERDGP